MIRLHESILQNWERWLFHLMHRTQHRRVTQNKETEQYVPNEQDKNLRKRRNQSKRR